MLLSFRTDRSGQTVQRSSLIRICTVCNSGYIFWVHISSVKPSCSKFRVITANFRVSEILGFLRYIKRFFTKNKILSRLMTKPTKWHVRPAKTQISLISLRCLPEEALNPYLPKEHTAKALIRLGRCLGWHESSLGNRSFCYFCRVAAQIGHIMGKPVYAICKQQRHRSAYISLPDLSYTYGCYIQHSKTG